MWHEVLQRGGIIAYPTEAVYGLGCDPFNEKSVLRLLALKKRSIDKGLILIASSWQQIQHLTKPIPEKSLNAALATWPGPITWIFPAQSNVPYWLRGKHKSIALRVTAHTIAKKICEDFGGPIVSTSANIEGAEPARTSTEVLQQFPEGIDYIVPGKIGKLANPTEIRNVLTGEILRI